MNLIYNYVQVADGRFGWVVMISTITLMSWLPGLITGAALVLVAPRLGMATCVLVAGIHTTLSAALLVYAISVIPGTPWLSWIGPTVSLFAYTTVLLLGGATIRRRQMDGQFSSAGF
jgi:hypothetical protein